MVYRLKVFDLVQSYPAGAGLERLGQVPFAGSLEPSGTQEEYWSVQLLGTPQLSYFKSVKL
jgi:hypothetical protein